ncbi:MULTISPECIES: alpha/beta hydrolase [unclassified Luteimonas]|uniref:alpha/beta hydrolase n=1 Tax=unclassified Luteimonas TaxID=2629088 RepID=UPI001600C08A|nr:MULTISPECIES: alpha/beta hydrolase [unclassified Luteimonas]MBB1471819.1 alpha/beta hydrolase [Luteimonas sp. MC1782]MBB6599438.1 alpha/beta hydrolase [Luteimonas sp. MC1825]QOC87141.1 alpha/beta hydrolase [Luteimonas sp. MC1825]
MPPAPMRVIRAALVATALCLLAACAPQQAAPAATPLPADFACQAGAWRTATGAPFVLSPVDDGLRYRLLDGRTGRFETTGHALGDTIAATEGWREAGPPSATAVFGACRRGRMQVAFGAEPPSTATRMPQEIRDVRFRSNGIELRGRLVLPLPTRSPLPLAVLVHGSESWSAVDRQALQYLLPAQGVATFVYDKRGTGASQGSYTQDFEVLADDAVAAMAEARRMAGSKYSHAGFVGGSQAGWVAPLAASRGKAGYVVALYGLAESPLAEDREEVMSVLRARGHGDDVLRKARELTDASGEVMASGFTRGFDQLATVRARYAGEAWLDDVEGEFSGELLRIPAWLPQWLVRSMARGRDVGTPWHHDPLPVLASLQVPQLWVLAGDDREAPPANTLARLQELQAQQRPIDIVLYPGTDHGIHEFTEVDGERVDLRNPEGYHALLAGWIHDLQLPDVATAARISPRRGVAVPQE